MIILDTNVISAIMRLELEPDVAAWLDLQNPQHLFATSISLFEINFGIERMARGKKRTLHETRLATVMSDVIGSRLINFDRETSSAAAKAHVVRGKVNADHEAPDSLIAGTAIYHAASLATRNVKGFAGLGVKIVNPWNDGD